MYYVNRGPYSSLLRVMMSKSLVFAFFFLTSLGLVSAFKNVFDSWVQQQQQQQHEQQPQHDRSGHAYSDGASCSQYLCPGTLHCVALPKDCPCPNAEDIKCLIFDTVGGSRDATVVCTRGQNGCSEVENLLRRGVKSKKGWMFWTLILSVFFFFAGPLSLFFWNFHQFCPDFGLSLLLGAFSSRRIFKSPCLHELCYFPKDMKPCESATVSWLWISFLASSSHKVDSNFTALLCITVLWVPPSRRVFRPVTFISSM